jgi:acetyl esterase/lipase
MHLLIGTRASTVRELVAGGAVLCCLAAMMIMPGAAFAADAGKDAEPDKTEERPTASQPSALPPVPEGVLLQRDVAYLAADRKEMLDLYLPANRSGAARSPAVVIIHGGGWTGGTKSANREFNIGTTLAKAGYVCASV